jgi:nucleotide-binding universal stress UspA family protein
MLPTKRILHPTDFSERSADAFQVACALARDRGGHLVILYVVPRPVPATEVQDVALFEAAERDEQELRSYRAEMRRKLERLKVPYLTGHVERVLGEGEVATEILRAARDLSCDLIVMGTHGRTGDARRLLGSVAEAVTQGAPCPVLCLKGPLPQAVPTESPGLEELDVVL